jgi:two-component system, cell cycle response regulator
VEPQSLILVVDDQPSGQLVLAGLLEPEGYRLAFAASGCEALAQMRLLAPDLVLLDVMMPEMDGFEVCRRIRADAKLALIPVVMVTALDDQASLLQGIEAGADDFVTKPFSRIELRARIRTITRLNRFRTLLDEQRRVSSARAQLLWAIDRSADGYLLLDDADRLRDGNVRGWHYLGLDRSPDVAPDDTFLALAERMYRLEPAAAWERWPKPTQAPRYLVRSEGVDTLWLQVEVLDLPGNGPGRHMVHLRDVSGQIIAQRQVWTFHSFVSHKLRTPLTSLVTGMGLLQRQVAELPADLGMLLAIAYEGAQRLKLVVDDIFRYLDSPLDHVADRGALLSELEGIVAALGSELGVTQLELVAEPGVEPARLALSARTVELLIGELLENARKFHPHQHPSVVVTLRRRGGHFLISVADDGLTLSPAQLRRIWEPYRQIDLEFTGQVAGLGLGLAMVQQICWAAGGTCRIANCATGPGICVELELPLAPIQSSLD